MVNASGAESDTLRVPRRQVPQRWSLWVGRIFTAVPIGMMLFSASLKLAGSQQMVDEIVIGKLARIIHGFFVNNPG